MSQEEVKLLSILIDTMTNLTKQILSLNDLEKE